MQDKANIIKSVCGLLSSGNMTSAGEQVKYQYPFVAHSQDKRKYSEEKSLAIFRRDGFIDRYSGAKLIFPPVLRILSVLLPKEFPFQKNWKMSETHPAYWELFPTLDHVIPLARGGKDSEENLVTTSMLRNAAKANWTLDELGWNLVPAGNLDEWDGLLFWFMEFTEHNNSILKDKYINRWHKINSKN